MYTPRGHGLSELGDIEVVADDDGRLHLFHLTLPNHDVVQHAVSDDGLFWNPLPNALHTGDPGDADDDQIWTMSVTKVGEEWRMLYTALSRRDDGMVQRTNMAASLDLMHWVKSPRNPVAEADPRWYEASVSDTGSVSWRDPKPIRVDDRWYATVSAREARGPIVRRGCAGLISSDDFDRWTVEPPLFAPRGWWDLECPQVFSIAGRWYLTSAIMEDRTQRYWMAETFQGPYVTPGDGGMLAPNGHYAGRVMRWGETDLLFCWHQSRLVEGWRSSTRTIDWVTPRNPFGKHLVPPLELVARQDGTLERRSFRGWDGRVEGSSIPGRSASTTFHETSDGDDWRVACSAGVDLLCSRDAFDDFRLHLSCRMSAPRGGIAFRLDAHGGGWFIEFNRATGEVALQKWLPTEDPREARRGYRWEELQRADIPSLVSRSADIAVQLISAGPYVELAIDGAVILATLTGERLSGPIGLWVDSGMIVASDMRIEPLRV